MKFEEWLPQWEFLEVDSLKDCWGYQQSQIDKLKAENEKLREKNKQLIETLERYAQSQRVHPIWAQKALAEIGGKVAESSKQIVNRTEGEL